MRKKAYLIQCVRTKTYFAVTNDLERAKSYLLRAKAVYPDEEWVLIEQ